MNRGFESRLPHLCEFFLIKRIPEREEFVACIFGPVSDADTAADVRISILWGVMDGEYNSNPPDFAFLLEVLQLLLDLVPFTFFIRVTVFRVLKSQKSYFLKCIVSLSLTQCKSSPPSSCAWRRPSPCHRWFNVRIQLVGASVAVLAGSFVVWWGKDHIEATVAGLALLYALQFTDALKYLVRQHALLEMEMNSVRVMKGYVEEGCERRGAGIFTLDVLRVYDLAVYLTVEDTYQW